MQTDRQRAGRQCTREGVGTGSLGLVTTLALLLICRDTVDRQVDRQDRRLSVHTFGPQAAAVDGNVGRCAGAAVTTEEIKAGK